MYYVAESLHQICIRLEHHPKPFRCCGGLALSNCQTSTQLLI